MSARLVLDAIVAGYGRRTVLDRFSLAVAAGETVALVGPNGAGKTTVLDVVAGLVRCASGRLEWDGRSVTSLGPARRAALGWARSFQHDATFAGLDVRRHLTLDGPAARAASTADRFGLPGPARPGALSFADRRRLDLARVLSGDRHLVLLDEPSAGLGDADLRAVAGRLREMRPAPVVLMAEHDRAWIAALADRVVRLGPPDGDDRRVPEVPTIAAPEGAPAVLTFGAPARRPLRAGERRVARVDVTTVRPADGARVVTLDESRGLVEGLTVGEQLRLARGRRVDPSALGEMRRRLPGLPTDLTQPVGTLSGGERTLVGFAAAMLAAPDALVIVDWGRGMSASNLDAMHHTMAAVVEDGVGVLLIDARGDE